MRAIQMSLSRDTQFDLKVSKAAADESKLRQRDIQVKTAKKVIERFYDYREKQDASQNTDPEQIAFMVRHYESTIEAMLHREEDLQQKLDSQKKRNGMLTNKVEMWKKKHKDVSQILKQRDNELEEQRIKFGVVMTEMKNREQELLAVQA